MSSNNTRRLSERQFWDAVPGILARAHDWRTMQPLLLEARENLTQPTPLFERGILQDSRSRLSQYAQDSTENQEIISDLGATLAASGAFADEEQPVLIATANIKPRSVSPIRSSGSTPEKVQAAINRFEDSSYEDNGSQPFLPPFLPTHPASCHYCHSMARPPKHIRPEFVQQFLADSQACKVAKRADRARNRSSAGREQPAGQEEYPSLLQPRSRIGLASSAANHEKSDMLGQFNGRPGASRGMIERTAKDIATRSFEGEEGDVSAMVPSTENIIAVWEAAPALNAAPIAASVRPTSNAQQRQRRQRGQKKLGAVGIYGDTQQERKYQWCPSCRKLALHRAPECMENFPGLAETRDRGVRRKNN